MSTTTTGSRQLSEAAQRAIIASLVGAHEENTSRALRQWEETLELISTALGPVVGLAEILTASRRLLAERWQRLNVLEERFSIRATAYAATAHEPGSLTHTANLENLQTLRNRS